PRDAVTRAAEARVAELEAELLSARRSAVDEHERTRARLRAAEQQVAAVREALATLRSMATGTPASTEDAIRGETLNEAANDIERALDAASTPQLASETAPTLLDHGRGVGGVA